MQTLFWSLFEIFLSNVVKIDPYNFELDRFKVGTFFDTQCSFIVAGELLGPPGQRVNPMGWAIGLSAAN